MECFLNRIQLTGIRRHQAMFTPRYFKPAPPMPDGSAPPPPLLCTVVRTARFNEADALHIIWHGHYTSYFEDARMCFGKLYGITYQALEHEGLKTPIKQLHIDYIAPLLFDHDYSITTAMYWNDAARIDMEYIIKDMDGGIKARGYTVQMFTTPEGNLCFAKPPFYENFCLQWSDGSLHKLAKAYVGDAFAQKIQ